MRCRECHKTIKDSFFSKTKLGKIIKCDFCQKDTHAMCQGCVKKLPDIVNQGVQKGFFYCYPCCMVIFPECTRNFFRHQYS